MPRRIRFTNGNVTEYIYSVSGEKLRTIHRTAVANITVSIGSTLPLTTANTLSADSTDCIGDLELGSGLWHKYYFDGEYCRIFSGKTNVGGRRILPPPRNLWVTYSYYTQDHLGNNRAVVSENGTLEQVTHYYPFGGVYGDAGSDPELQNRKYNGKELDRMHGLDWYDYGARSYDAVVPMWTSIDTLCEKNYNISPYVYCDDDPIKYIDPNGKVKREFFDRDNPKEYSKELVQAYSDFEDGGDNVMNFFAHGMDDGFSYYGDKASTANSLYNIIQNDQELKKEFDNTSHNDLKIVLHMCNTSEYAQKVSSNPKFKDVLIIAPNGVLNVETHKDINTNKISKDVKYSISKSGKHGVWVAWKNGKAQFFYYDSMKPGTTNFNYDNNKKYNYEKNK